MSNLATSLRVLLFSAIVLIAPMASAGVMGSLPSWHAASVSFDATPSMSISNFDWDGPEVRSAFSQLDSLSSWGISGGIGSTLDFSAIHAAWSYVPVLAFAGVVCFPDVLCSDSPCYSLLKVPRSSI